MISSTPAVLETNHPSLSIDEGEDAPLVHCHAGCTQTDVIAALNGRGLWPERGDDEIRHSKLGAPHTVWTYRDDKGAVIGHVCRWETPKGKDIRPYVGGQWRHFDKPRPLYGLDRLARSPDAPVMVVEGEKAADAAQRMLGDRYVAMTWPGGTGGVSCVDWSPLKGRDVLVWPDVDDPGRKAANAILARLTNATRTNPPSDKPAGWDAADAEAEGFTGDDVENWVHAPDFPAGNTGNIGNSGGATGAASVPDTENANGNIGNSGGKWAFVSRKDGLFYHPPDRPDEPIKVCSPLNVTAMTRDDTGENWGRLLEFPEPDGRLHQYACPLELLAGDGSEFRRFLLSQGLRISPSQKARYCLAEYVQTTEVEERALCTGAMGWHRGVFVLPDESIGGTGERVLLQTLGEPPRMEQAGTPDEWGERIGKLCIGNSRLALAVSAAFAPPLLDALGDESGGIHIVGPSSTGKTTALRIAASVWGGPAYLHRWRATANGLEAVAQSHNDALLVLDELAQVDAHQAGEVAYMLANGSGKHRAQKSGLAKRAATWRLLFISAGEIGLSQHMAQVNKRARAGQEVRLADVPADAGAGAGIFEELHGYADGAKIADAITQLAAQEHGTPIRSYLRQLLKLPRDWLGDRLEDVRGDFITRAVPSDADGQTRRVASRFGLVAAAGELATHFDLTGWREGEAMDAALTCYAPWIGQRGGSGSQEDSAAVAQVRHFLEAHGESRFSTPDAQRVVVNRAGYRRVLDGKVCYLFLREVFRREVCQGLDYKHTARVLAERGHLHKNQTDRHMFKSRELGSVYAVRESILEGGGHE